jgi:hypothetical protein
MNIRATIVGLACLLSGLSGTASALHIDVVVGSSAGKLTTSFCANGAPGCDALPVLQQLGLPVGTLARELGTGKPIYVTDFGDFDGGLFAVDDPGFFAGAGALPGNLLLRYQARGSLSYWNPGLDEWQNATPQDERIRLFGGLDVQTVISTDTSHCKGLLICIPKQVTNTVTVEGSTLFTDTGVQGAPSLIVDNTAANGSLHAHLDWFIELPNGQRNGTAGAYLLEMQLTANGFQASDPFLIMFNRGLDNAEFGRALGVKIFAPAPPPDPDPVPVPAAIWLMGTALVTLGGAARRRRRSDGSQRVNHAA